LFEAPIALKSHGIFAGKKVTSHPSVDKQLKEAGKTCKSYDWFHAVDIHGLINIAVPLDTVNP